MDNTSYWDPMSLLKAEVPSQYLLQNIASGVNTNIGSAEQPASRTDYYKIAFYNVGWTFESKRQRKPDLAHEVLDRIHEHQIDALGICEVFNIRNADRPEQIDLRGEVMRYLLEVLNTKTPTGAASSAGQPAWEGKADGHYIFLWHSQRLSLEAYEYVSCGVLQQPWRMAQYLRFTIPDHSEARPLHICHCHSPASKVSKLTAERRRQIFASLWNQVLAGQREAQFHQAVYPVCLFGGGYSTADAHWPQILGATSNLQENVNSAQLCVSTREVQRRHHDIAIAINAYAVHQEAEWGKSFHKPGQPEPFSDSHDAVVVKLCWKNLAAWGKRGGAAPQDHHFQNIRSHREATIRTEEVVLNSLPAM